jgi:hypothetical protein
MRFLAMRKKIKFKGKLNNKKQITIMITKILITTSHKRSLHIFSKINVKSSFQDTLKSNESFVHIIIIIHRKVFIMSKSFEKIIQN